MESLDGYELDCVIESILFASGEPVEIEALADGLGVGKLMVETTLQKMADEYAFAGRGIRIIRLEDSVQMCTAAEYAPYIKHILYTRNQHMRLSPAALEALAIIAYNQPVTRAYIEQIRRVDCTGVLSGLMEKGLIREDGQLDVPGRPNLYVVTSEFLRCFGLSSIEELPELPELASGRQTEEAAPSAAASADESIPDETAAAAMPDDDPGSDGAAVRSEQERMPSPPQERTKEKENPGAETQGSLPDQLSFKVSDGEPAMARRRE